jgi:hypothetical protein
MLAEPVQRLLPVLRECNVVSLLLQHIAQQRPHLRLVVNDKNMARAM